MPRVAVMATPISSRRKKLTKRMMRDSDFFEM